MARAAPWTRFENLTRRHQMSALAFICKIFVAVAVTFVAMGVQFILIERDRAFEVRRHAGPDIQARVSQKAYRNEASMFNSARQPGVPPR